MKKNQQNQNSSAAGSSPEQTRDLLTKEEFAERIAAPSTRLVDELIRKRKIPVIRLGWRTVRIPYKSAMEALWRLQVNAIGA